MCILCVIQKWSRRVAAMLPWLVVPLIALWAVSQLLPPAFRFEITSPRLACVSVLLVTLFWYEVAMPRLSAWREHRDADRRQMKRFQAIEIQKLRKMATRRCRNCFSPYRDQNPGGGRFMCSYCGHISKRPVLDITASASLGVTDKRNVFGQVIGKGGVTCPQTSWFCANDWLCNGNSILGAFPAKSSSRGKTESQGSSNDSHCFKENTSSGTVPFLGRSSIYFRWICRKVFRVNLVDDEFLDGENNGFKKGHNWVILHESKEEKARRKAEERRQARLEKEHLEEDEKKQREEVSRLVEERRRLRDEKMEAEKVCMRSSASERGKKTKREVERQRQERKQEKEKGSNKSNSDCEEPERKARKECEKKQVFDRRSESERRDIQRTAIESVRAQISQMKNAAKVGSTNSFKRANGARYPDHVKGSVTSSPKGSNGASFVRKDTHASANNVPKASWQSGSVNRMHITTSWRSSYSNGHLPGKPSPNGDDKMRQLNVQRSVTSEIQQPATPKKSWQQLFTRSSAVTPISNSGFVNTLNHNLQTETQSSYSPVQSSPSDHPFGDQISLGIPLPFCSSPFSSGSRSVSPISSTTAEPNFLFVGEPSYDLLSEESDVYEDPCYVPDPVSLLGPVSESLDKFSLDLGIVNDTESLRDNELRRLPAPLEFNKPSPIKAPASRVRLFEGGYANSSSFLSTPKSQNVHTSPLHESSDGYEQGTWQMWGASLIGHDGFGLVGSTASWLSPLGKNKHNQDEVLQPSSYKAIELQFPHENQNFPGPLSPQIHVGSFQNGGTFNPLGPGSNSHDPCLQKNTTQPLLGDGRDEFPPLSLQQDVFQEEIARGKTESSHPFELASANCWPKRECGVRSEEGVVGHAALPRPHIGGLFCTPNVQSLWSFN